MVKAKFSNKMIDILKSMVGNIFSSYEYGDMFPNEAFGNLQINLKDFSVELFNEVQELPFYDLTEDISCFKCIKKSLTELFEPYCKEPSQKYSVNEKILSVFIVDDSISINDGEYDINFDMAVIIETSQHKYIFSRGWFFSETINISIDEKFDDIYPIGKVIEDWSDEGENNVTVVRNIRKL